MVDKKIDKKIILETYALNGIQWMFLQRALKDLKVNHPSHLRAIVVTSSSGQGIPPTTTFAKRRKTTGTMRSGGSCYGEIIS